MTKKTKKEQNKKNDNNFDIETAMNELSCPDMFKAGLKSYITRNEIKINNSNDFKKTVKKYSEVTL